MASTITCTCPRIKLGSEVTSERTWDPDCPAHGTGSAWYRFKVTVADREVDGARLRIVQTVSRLRRQDRISLEAAQEIVAALGADENQEDDGDGA